MSATPAFAATPRCAVGQVTTANTNRDGTGAVATVFTPGASGSKVERVRIQAVGATSAGVVRLFVNDGTNTRLLREGTGSRCNSQRCLRGVLGRCGLLGTRPGPGAAGRSFAAGFGPDRRNVQCAHVRGDY